MKTINYKLAVVGLLILLGCKTIEYPYCIGKTTRLIKVSWGVIVQNTSGQEIYMLSTDKAIYRMDTTKKSSKKLKTLSDKEYCNLLYQINETFLKTQVINEVGDTLQFVQYENPAIGVYSRAVWNPNFRTKNSLLFRELFDTLTSKTNYY